jgi:hypothetical protein
MKMGKRGREVTEKDILGDEIVKIRRPIHRFLQFRRRIPWNMKQSPHRM